MRLRRDLRHNLVVLQHLLVARQLTARRELEKALGSGALLREQGRVSLRVACFVLHANYMGRRKFSVSDHSPELVSVKPSSFITHRPKEQKAFATSSVKII